MINRHREKLQCFYRSSGLKRIRNHLAASLLASLILLLGACDSNSPESAEPVDSDHATAASTNDAAALRLLHNARIYTFDDNGTVFEHGAILLSGDGFIQALGPAPDLMAVFPQAEWYDLAGKTIFPGLIDAHAHFVGLAESLTQADLMGTGSIAEVVERLRTFESTLAEGDWLQGMGWDQNDWPLQQFPGKADLDEAFPERPVWLRRIDGHAGWANSAALAAADRDLNGDWQPQGGKVHRDASGQATGVLIDGAMELIDSVAPAVSRERLELAIDEATEILLSLGLTGVHDAGLDWQDIQLLKNRADQGRLGVRVYAMAAGVGEAMQHLCEDGNLDHPSGRLSVRSVKLFADGALGSRGAALLEDYSDEPGSRGLLFVSDAEMQDAVRQAMECNLQVAVHAIGDDANRQVLDAYAAEQPRFPNNPGRHRIEHSQVIALNDIQRFADLNVIASMQPTHATSDMYWAQERLGDERVLGAYAWRLLLDAGVRLALGSDFPVEQVNPMLGIHAAVTRQDVKGWPNGGWYADQVLTREEAIRGFTADAAWAAFMESQVGSLETGKRADFIVVDRDLMQVEAEEIPQARVLQTWLDGELVWMEKVQ